MPGLRELRAPLAAGYLWLLIAWMTIGAPSRNEVSSAAIRRVYDLEPLVSDLGIAVIVSVVAYTIGAIALDVGSRLGEWADERAVDWWSYGTLFEQPRRAWAWIRRLPARLRPRPYMTPKESVGEGQLSSVLLKGLRASGREPASYPVDIATPFRSTRELVKVRLLDLSPALHSEVDRPDAEATFRLAIWPPLTVLSIYLASTVSLWWLLALLLPAALAWQWTSLRRRADEALMMAIAAREELQPPLVERLALELESRRQLMTVEESATA
jgi:hypothetical protein